MDKHAVAFAFKQHSQMTLMSSWHVAELTFGENIDHVEQAERGQLKRPLVPGER